MLEHLFGSKTRFKLLKTFFRHPEKSFYVRELERLLGAQINAIRRELGILLLAELIKELEINPAKDDIEQGSALRRYYTLNTDSMLFSEMQALLLKAQLLGEKKFMEDIKEKGGKIKLLLLSGRFTGEQRAPSDLLIVGDLKEKAILRIIRRYEKEFGFEVRYTLMSEKEFTDRRQMMDKFLYTMFEVENIKEVNKFNI